jgi:hypothetical protein
VFEYFSIVAGTIGVDWVGVCVLAFVVVFLRGALFEEKGWRVVDRLGGGGALVERVSVPVVLGCCFKSP